METIILLAGLFVLVKFVLACAVSAFSFQVGVLWPLGLVAIIIHAVLRDPKKGA